MTLPELPPFLTLWPDGEVVVVGTRITLYDVLFYYLQGESAEMIAVRYSHVPLATIHKTIAFYLENRASLDAYVAEYTAALEVMRAAGPTVNLAELRARLASRAAAGLG